MGGGLPYKHRLQKKGSLILNSLLEDPGFFIHVSYDNLPGVGFAHLVCDEDDSTHVFFVTRKHIACTVPAVTALRLVLLILATVAAPALPAQACCSGDGFGSGSGCIVLPWFALAAKKMLSGQSSFW